MLEPVPCGHFPSDRHDGGNCSAKSRARGLIGLALACLVLGLPAGRATAQDVPDKPIQILITREKETYGAPVRKPKRCGAPDEKGEIVVCGADHGEQWRVPSTTDSDPASREAQNTGMPHAPGVNGLPGCARGCIGIGKGPPPVYIINLEDIPEAPADSDAQKVANGELSDR